MTGATSAILFLTIFVLAAAALVLGFVIRRYRRELGLAREERQKTGNVSFIISAFHEVTKQLKEKEQELERLRSLAEKRAEEVESYNKDILRCVTNGVIAFDGKRLATAFNRAAEEILAVPQEDRLGTSCIDIFGEGEICRAVQITFEQQRPVTRGEASISRPDGTVWLGYNTALLTDQQEKPLGVILSFSDLTEVKRLQEQMELRERLTALGEMSAGIAHELRNPMAVIAGYLKLFSRKADDAQKKILGDIGDEINGMNRIIGDLLMFARPAALNRVQVNIQELLEGCLAAVLQARGGGPVVTTRISLSGEHIAADEGLLKQSFCNIIQNAVEAMPDGGELGIESRLVGREVIVSIRDAGSGILADKLKKIFLPFFTTKDKGTGLGLALAHKFILSHGGRIEVESEEGKGSLFTVSLPKG
jgi:two-component system, NtrC family, sensor histidine kinase AtoS